MAKARASRQRGAWKPGTELVVQIVGALPVPKGSMRAFMPPGGKFPVVTASKGPELRAWERDVRLLCEAQLDRLGLPCAVEQPFEVQLVYYLPRARGDFDSHGGVRGAARSSPWVKPDFDKLVRSTLDACTGMVWDDDSRVVRAVIEKRFATPSRDIGLWYKALVLPATMREVAVNAQQQIQGA